MKSFPATKEVVSLVSGLQHIAAFLLVTLHVLQDSSLEPCKEGRFTCHGFEHLVNNNSFISKEQTKCKQQLP